MNHCFFSGVDFDDVKNQKIDAPWIPDLKSLSCTKFFDSYPEKNLSVDSLPEEMNKEIFGDFPCN